MDKSRKWQTWLEGLRTELTRLPALAQAETSAEAKRDAAKENVRRLKGMVATAQQEKAEASHQLQNVDQELRTHDLSKPGFWARLCRTRAARKWAEIRQALLEQQNTETVWQAAYAQHQQAKQRLAEAQETHRVVLVDATFFALEHDKRHQATPWFPATAQRQRDEVFISAIALHRAFIDAAAKPLRHNLGALVNVFTTQTLPGVERQALLPDLWASLFLVVPLVSTTFASVNRMLGELPLESLGWLLVDEAVQALPQAAVGALLRTRRAVIVGDPVQIEPVVILPDTLTHAICHRLRQIVRDSGVLEGWVADTWCWTNERIGTVHTVQGREAEAVILVLGAPHPAQTGARGWAGGRPNLLNVAVTRAKEVICVIGNRQLWREAGLFRELDKRLP